MSGPGSSSDALLTKHSKGEKVTAKAHGGKIDIEGVTVAEVDDKVRLRKVETWFDPMEMFRQIAPQGIVNKEIVSSKVEQQEPPKDLPVNDGIKIAQDHNKPNASHSADPAPADAIAKEISPSTGLPADQFVPHQGTSTLLEQKNTASSDVNVDKGVSKQELGSDVARETSKSQQAGIGPQAGSVTSSENGASSDSSDKTWEKVDRPKQHAAPTDINKQDSSSTSMEAAVKPDAGQAVVASAQSEETRRTHEEMSNITPMECPFLMNRE